MRVCIVSDCEKVHLSKGYCLYHYRRYRKYGTPDIPPSFIIDGRTKHPNYGVYWSMLQRCRDPHVRNYHKYGGAGITVCERWTGLHGFDNFNSDMGVRPSLKYSIDRIDNNGNYEPGNCKWSTVLEQAHNRGLWITNISGHAGVTWDKQRNIWRANIMREGVAKYLGKFKDVEKAAEAYAAAERRYKSGLPL